jgi:histidinol dehydrogenase
MFSQNVGFQLPSDAASYPGGADTCYTSAQTAGVAKVYRVAGGDQI